MAPDDKPPPSLEDLDSRLRRARQKEQPGDGLKTPKSNLGRALSLAIEMAAALAVGFGIGWYLDRWLGTKPWLLVVFLIIGLAAGVRNVMRVIARINAETEREEREAADRARSERPKDDRG
ncbi:MAG: AtpZ/AtpI family protein [Alphaproteobacteria bacterium]